MKDLKKKDQEFINGYQSVDLLFNLECPCFICGRKEKRMFYRGEDIRCKEHVRETNRDH